MKQERKRQRMRIAKYKKVDPEMLYSREEASKAMGVSSYTFKKNFMNNAQFMQDGSVSIPDSSQTFYKGKEINHRIDVLTQIQSGILNPGKLK